MASAPTGSGKAPQARGIGIDAFLLRLLAPAAVVLFVGCGDGGEPGATVAPTATTAAMEEPSPTESTGALASGKIAFKSYREGQADIYVMNADGSEMTNLTGGAITDANLPVWSPDGTRIAFSACCDSTYVMYADGSGVTLLSNAEKHGDAYGTVWSPDGARIAFGTEEGQIWVANSDGSGLARLTDVSGGAIGSAWSPDGSALRSALPALPTAGTSRSTS